MGFEILLIKKKRIGFYPTETSGAYDKSQYLKVMKLLIILSFYICLNEINDSILNSLKALYLSIYFTQPYIGCHIIKLALLSQGLSCCNIFNYKTHLVPWKSLFMFPSSATLSRVSWYLKTYI